MRPDLKRLVDELREIEADLCDLAGDAATPRPIVGVCDNAAAYVHAAYRELERSNAS